MSTKILVTDDLYLATPEAPKNWFGMFGVQVYNTPQNVPLGRDRACISRLLLCGTLLIGGFIKYWPCVSEAMSGVDQ